ncbi:MAG: class I SAM-dependent methyltransferase [Polyangiales bacterium]
MIAAAIDQIPSIERVLGVDINAEYASHARSALATAAHTVAFGPLSAQKLPPREVAIEVRTSDFFQLDGASLLHSLPDPLLVIGNPPWVTNAGLGVLQSDNLPRKTNASTRLSGLDARMGKSNFDISEWMILRLLDWVEARDAIVAVLCKTAIARKVVSAIFTHRRKAHDARIYRIAAARWFGANVEACLLSFCTGVVREVANVGATFAAASPSGVTQVTTSTECSVFPDLHATRPTHCFGHSGGALIADLEAHAQSRHLKREGAGKVGSAGKGAEGVHAYRWRSGIKHDCAKVMEISEQRKASLEEHYVFPMLKSSQLPLGRVCKWMVVPQRRVSDDTEPLARNAPSTHRYLVRNSALLDRRKSSIYRGKPRFSVFGVGDYSFTPWKVAISSMYKRLVFYVIGPHEGKPVVLDDTVYFLPCDTRDEAEGLRALLHSESAQTFYRSYIFWDAKRPITAEILQRLDLQRLGASANRKEADSL